MCVFSLICNMLEWNKGKNDKQQLIEIYDKLNE